MGIPTTIDSSPSSTSVVSTNSERNSNNNSFRNVTGDLPTTTTAVVLDLNGMTEKQHNHDSIDYEQEQEYEEESVGCSDNDDDNDSDNSIISLDSSASLLSEFDMKEFNDSFDNASMQLISPAVTNKGRGILLKDRTKARVKLSQKKVSFCSNVEVREYERILMPSNEYIKICDNSSSYSSCVLFELAIGWQYESCTQTIKIQEPNRSSGHKVCSELYGPVLYNSSDKLSISKRRIFTRKNRTRKSIHRSPYECNVVRCQCMNRKTETERYDLLQNYGFDSIELIESSLPVEGSNYLFYDSMEVATHEI